MAGYSSRIARRSGSGVVQIDYLLILIYLCLQYASRVQSPILIPNAYYRAFFMFATSIPCIPVGIPRGGIV
jgi:hypothetical protein